MENLPWKTMILSWKMAIILESEVNYSPEHFKELLVKKKDMTVKVNTTQVRNAIIDWLEMPSLTDLNRRHSDLNGKDPWFPIEESWFADQESWFPLEKWLISSL